MTVALTPHGRIRRLLDDGRAVLLDGPMGSELVRRGVRWRWHALRTAAEQVEALHREYIDAGADVIRTNTFQLNPRIYLNVFRDRDHMRHIGAPGVEGRARELIDKAVAVARIAREASGRACAIAGVMSPLEHCYRPDLRPPLAESKDQHGRIAAQLAERGVDMLILESMNNRGEAETATVAAIATGLPVWVSFVLGPEGELLSGEPLGDAARAMERLGVEAVLVNCAPPDGVTPALPRLRSATGLPVGAFAQIGKFDPPSWKFEFHPQFSGVEEWPPARYAGAAENWRGLGASIIGGCCGTGPDHIRALREVL